MNYWLLQSVSRALIPALLVSLASVCVRADSGLGLVPFPKAREVFHTDTQTQDYRLTLGELKKINSEWRAEHEKRLEGDLHRVTLEIPAGHTAKEAFRYYVEQLQEMASRELYHCEEWRCGSSSSWANNRFEISLLYGLDKHQYYGAYEVVGPQQQLFFVSLYTVARGNKRVYAQVDILRSSNSERGIIAASPQSIADELKARGVYVLPGFSVAGKEFQLESEHLKALVDALQRERGLKVAVVGHDYGPGDIARQQATSLAYAEYVKTQLVEAGVAKERIGAYGVGSLAPGRRGDRSLRVEIVRVEGF